MRISVWGRLLRRSTAHSPAPLAAGWIGGRSYFQGGPSPGTPGSKSKADEYLRSKASEIDERQEMKRAEHDQYYSDPSRPKPLYENAFPPGKFGMRRRLVVLKRREKGQAWSVKERSEAVADAQASFFK